MARHFPRGAGMARSRRQTFWIGSANFNAFRNLALNGVAVDQDLLGAVAGALSPFTITRTVGFLALKSDQVAAAEEGTFAVGGMVVKETARAAGVASLPTPIIEMDDDGWFLYQQGSFSGGPIEGAPVRNFAFDSRAQRKVEDGDAVVFMVENASAAAGCDYDFWFRMLIKLH